MAAGYQDALLLAAQQDAANRENNGLAITAGALAGAAYGVVGGNAVHRGRSNQLLQRLADRTQIPMAPGKPFALRPGARMAGGLVGAIAGGALGAGLQNIMMRESPAARYLAKVQVGDPLTDGEAEELENILTKTYSSILA